MELRWNTPQVHSNRCHARRTAGVWLVRDSFVLQTIGRGSFVGEAVGLHVADAARDYIHLHRGDPDALASSLERVQRAATPILHSLAPAKGAPAFKAGPLMRSFWVVNTHQKGRSTAR